MAAYLNAAFEDGDPAVIKLALKNIARAKGMPKVAEDAGVDRQVVFMVLAPDGEPNFASVSTLKTIGLPLSAAA
jgi:probable addiction module antidote protein